ncbi:hypothetical protein [Roseateles amylovorans]|uniref:CHAD domain-containing protein n=1 Tax=Roseateles amylovorans TaxID=2978473 RepID=A0ABY6AYN9_9BURK|nr:hypothetical protein [Roseateles amylovorans]UXH76864.1 hypothetical protein N4261_17750 [Roseateles amylovorans]
MNASLPRWEEQETHPASSLEWAQASPTSIASGAAPTSLHPGTAGSASLSSQAPESALSPGAANSSTAPSTGLASRLMSSLTARRDGSRPPRRRSGDSILQNLIRLWPGEGHRPRASARAMADLRSAFRGSLMDLVEAAQEADDVVSGLRLQQLLQHIVHARHPQDLWHLRTGIYTEIARVHDQREADRRLADLNARLDRRRGRLLRLLG